MRICKHGCDVYDGRGFFVKYFIEAINYVFSAVQSFIQTIRRKKYSITFIKYVFIKYFSRTLDVKLFSVEKFSQLFTLMGYK